MAGRTTAGFLLVWFGTFCLLGSFPAHADDGQKLRDARAVYCLSPARRTDLVHAAVSLGLVPPPPSPPSVPSSSPGAPPSPSRQPIENILINHTPVPLLRWRTADPASFEKACEALARSGPSRLGDEKGPWQSIIGGMIPVVVGALLTLIATTWHTRMDRRAKAAAELRTAAIAYRRAAEEYMDGWLKPGPQQPPDEPVRRARLDLEEQLSVVSTLRLRARTETTDLLKSLRRQVNVPWGDVAGWTAAGQRKKLKEYHQKRTGEISSDMERIHNLATVFDSVLPFRWAAVGKRITKGFSALLPAIRRRAGMSPSTRRGDAP
ncbi:hypothetical protein [Streptosporangium sp. NPDC006007]|uniref:hypothetical protein n=1 Tax=Streptosporangium sp. NPDC006007 TaxID=3154575 RepID=UPI0033A144E1